MEVSHVAGRWTASVLVAAGTAGAVLVLAGAQTPARLPLVLTFLTAVPGLAMASLLSGFDSLARIVVAGAGAIVIDALIAEAMVASGIWSERIGVVAIAVVSVLIAATRALIVRSSAPDVALARSQTER